MDILFKILYSSLNKPSLLNELYNLFFNDEIYQPKIIKTNIPKFGTVLSAPKSFFNISHATTKLTAIETESLKNLK